MPLEELRLNADEVACVKRMAELYKEGRTSVVFYEDLEETTKDIGLTMGNRDAVLGVMEQSRIIEGVQHVRGMRFCSFIIGPQSLQVARAIEAAEDTKKEPRDIVAEVQQKANRHPFLAWLMIGSVVLAATLTIINQAAELLERFGVIKQP